MTDYHKNSEKKILTKAGSAHFAVSVETHKRLKAYCRANGRIISWQVNVCINEWLDEQEETNSNERRVLSEEDRGADAGER